jgi:hypothetical protein
VFIGAYGVRRFSNGHVSSIFLFNRMLLVNLTPLAVALYLSIYRFPEHSHRSLDLQRVAPVNLASN